MDKICVIYQPRGVGDILYLQKFARLQIKKGYKIYWPVMEVFKWLNDYIPDIQFIPFNNNVNFYIKSDTDFRSLNIFTDNYIFFDPFSAIEPSKGDIVMSNKYNSIGLDYKDWASYLSFNRNIEKENYLFYDILKLKDSEPYIFVNKNYQMRPTPLYANHVVVPNHLPIAELRIIDGITLFDWCKVIENASEIHMIETSLNYVMESPLVKPNLKAKVLKLYSRHKNFDNVKYLFNINWEYVCGSV